MERSQAIEILGSRPAATGVFCDFDGTLSDIVDEPAAAVAVDGASEALESLALIFGLVAVVSGRSLDDLRGRLRPGGVLLLGSYGRERSDRRGPRPATGGWEAVSIAAAARLERLPGTVLERKGAGVALHYRRAPELGGEVTALARELAAAFDLEVRPGRLVAELTARGPGKGEAVAEIVAQRRLEAALCAGDDSADLEAFTAIREASQRSVAVAVASEESPQGLLEAADLVVGSPRELVALLQELATRPG